MPRGRRGLTRLYLGTKYICLTPLDLHYLARMFNIIHQQLRDYVLAFPDLLSFVSISLTSVVYVEPMPTAITHIKLSSHVQGTCIICVIPIFNIE